MTLTWADVGADSYDVFYSTSNTCDIADIGSCPQRRLRYWGKARRCSSSPLLNEQIYYVTLVANPALGVSAFAQAAIRPAPWGTNGPVNAVAVAPDGTTYLGGSFTGVGPTMGGGVPLPMNSNLPRVPFPRVNGEIHAATPDGDRGLVYWWEFHRSRRPGTEIGSRTPWLMVQCRAGTPTLNDLVSTLAVSGGTVLRRGGFHQHWWADTQPYRGAGCHHRPGHRLGPERKRHSLDPRGLGQHRLRGGPVHQHRGTGHATLSRRWMPPRAWPPPGTRAQTTRCSPSRSRAAPSTRGAFSTNIGGQTRNLIAALDAATGLATAWDPSANNLVWTLAVSGGTVYVGGDFTSIGGQTRNRIAALDATAGLATAWDPNADNTVFTLAVSGGTVYAGGDFTSIGGQTRNRIAGARRHHWPGHRLGPERKRDTVLTLAVSGSTVYAGGDFNSIGGQTRNLIAALDATTGLATAWDPNANGTVRTLAVSGSTVYAGGQFNSIGGQTRNRIAALDATHGPGHRLGPERKRHGAHPRGLGQHRLRGGASSPASGGQTGSRIVALDATTGLATAWDPSANNTVWTPRGLGQHRLRGGPVHQHRGADA